jgi:hypothetical protein
VRYTALFVAILAKISFTIHSCHKWKVNERPLLRPFYKSKKQKTIRWSWRASARDTVLVEHYPTML